MNNEKRSLLVVKNRFLKRNLLFLLNPILGLMLLGCQENKSAQCQQIFQLARSVVESNESFELNKQQSMELQDWLQAANQLNQAADNIEALKISQSKLIQYQNQLVTVYRIYAQATYDAVQARENMNLEALKLARGDAAKAGEIQRELLQKINNYCLTRQ